MATTMATMVVATRGKAGVPAAASKTVGGRARGASGLGGARGPGVRERERERERDRKREIERERTR